ncbi:hypothetical protein [Methylobacterium sp. ID0610]|uniref:hypothetical protein n=1 Tax=Methylobacterium carpenticola TaxID=3344827 RepID=UPI0036A4D2CD
MMHENHLAHSDDASGSQWDAIARHRQRIAESAARAADARPGEDQAAALIAVAMHDIAQGTAAVRHDLADPQVAAPARRPAPRPFGAFAGRFGVSDDLFEPLPAEDLRAWEGR